MIDRAELGYRLVRMRTQALNMPKIDKSVREYIREVFRLEYVQYIKESLILINK